MEIAKQNESLTRHADLPGLGPKLMRQAFGPQFLDASHCRRWLATVMHWLTPVCPACGQEVPEGQLARFGDWQRIKCTGCGRTFRATTGTALEGCKLDPQQVVIILLGLGLGWDNALIAATAKVSGETARTWRKDWQHA